MTYGFDQDTAAEILRRLSEGETLRSICREDGMPAKSTVYNWRKADPQGFGAAYDEAMLQGCHALLDETLEIADDSARDFKSGEDGEIFDSEHVQRSKLRIWARHELIKRKRPDVFSDKQQHEHSGPGGGPIPIAAAQLTDDQLAAIAAGSS